MTRARPGPADPLSDAEKRHFVKQGFPNVPSAVSPRLVRVHAAAPNLSGNIRYMCFFRLSVRGLANHRVESMLDIWRDWPALGKFVGRNPD